MAVRAKDCSCTSCVDACHTQPGWFAPGEAEKAAAFLGLSFAECFRRYLVWDYWCDDEDIDVLRPAREPRAVEELRGGHRVSWGSALARGRCVFLTQDNRCQIHPVKPMECREVLVCEDRGGFRERIAELWAAARKKGRV